MGSHSYKVVRCKPLTKDHLPLNTAFSGPKGWSLVTGFTVTLKYGRKHCASSCCTTSIVRPVNCSSTCICILRCSHLHIRVPQVNTQHAFFAAYVTKINLLTNFPGTAHHQGDDGKLSGEHINFYFTYVCSEETECWESWVWSWGTLCMYSKTCQGDHSDKATTCPKRPLEPGPRDAISSQLTLDKETTW